ncbi:hypothetical protein BKA63DRAFT_569128 [Paraphoma chrysanthemicola]|nr:hypothetical protein BKA63DRAFT_569128 [Paraphoma chrysanthemicola]
MTNLLDLPPEIFQIVIGSFVACAGIKAAWKRRDVCTTFASYITHDIISNQPAAIYSDLRGHRLLLPTLPAMLERRTQVLTSLPSPLPSAVIKVVDVIMQATGQTTQKERTACTKKVCEDFFRLSDKAVYYVFHAKGHRAKNISSATGGEEAMCLAIGNGDRTLVQKLMQHGVTVWGNTKLFRDTMEYATTRGTIDMIRDIITLSGTAANGRKMIAQQRNLDKRIADRLDIYHAITPLSNHEDIVTELLKWYDNNPSATFRKRSFKCFAEAAHRSASKFWPALFARNPSHKIRKVYGDEFLKGAGWYGRKNPATVYGMLLRERVFEASDINRSAAREQWHDQKCLLNIAVTCGDYELTKDILNLGACPNSVKVNTNHPLGRLSYPLETALRLHDLPLAKLLVEYGADILMEKTPGRAEALVQSFTDPRSERAVWYMTAVNRARACAQKNKLDE